MVQSPTMEEPLRSPHATYREGLRSGALLFQRCTTCAAAVFPPRVVCPHCGAMGLETAQSAGRGTVYSTTSVSQRDADAYTVSLIDLDEGFRMMSTVQGPGAESVEIGQAVSLRIETADPPRASFVIGLA